MTAAVDRSVKMFFCATSVGSHQPVHGFPVRMEISNLNLEPLVPRCSRGAQLLGEGKWHETFGLTPT